METPQEIVIEELVMNSVNLVVGLGYGDEGKGATVDHLTRQNTGETLVVRYNGGPQAAHNVVTAGGNHHTFAQYGSGTLAYGHTYLSQHMLINPDNLLRERKHLVDECNVDSHYLDTHMYVHEDAKVILPWHITSGTARELARGNRRHGSCGQGVGECMKEAAQGRFVTVKYLLNTPRQQLEKNLTSYENYYIKTLEDQDIHLERCDLNDFLWKVGHFLDVVEVVSDSDLDWLLDIGRTNLIFEGAQGVLLDMDHGWFPYVTYSNTTAENAFDILRSVPNSTKLLEQSNVIGITRAYHTRHGAGPFLTHNSMSQEDPCGHNGIGEWQGEFKVGNLDLVMLDYATRVCPVDEVAVTCLDQVEYSVQVADSYNHQTVSHGKSVEAVIPTISRPAHLNKRAELSEAMLNGKYGISFKSISDEQELLEKISKATKAPVSYISHGPTSEDRVNLKDLSLQR